MGLSRLRSQGQVECSAVLPHPTRNRHCVFRLVDSECESPAPEKLEFVCLQCLRLLTDVEGGIGSAFNSETRSSRDSPASQRLKNLLFTAMRI